MPRNTEGDPKTPIDQVIGKRPNKANNDENQSPYPGGVDPYADFGNNG